MEDTAKYKVECSQSSDEKAKALESIMQIINDYVAEKDKRIQELEKRNNMIKQEIRNLQNALDETGKYYRFLGTP